MGILLAASVGISAAPAPLMRAVFYPISYSSAIEQSAEAHGVDPYLVCAVIKCESDWNASASSDAGAQGLMQLMPATAREVATMGLVKSSTYDPDNLTDPATNIEYGCAYLAYLSSQCDSNDEVIAAYNAGLGTVQTWKSGQPSSFADAITYPETRLYLTRVNEAYAHYRELYPNGITRS